MGTSIHSPFSIVTVEFYVKSSLIRIASTSFLQDSNLKVYISLPKA